MLGNSILLINDHLNRSKESITKMIKLIMNLKTPSCTVQDNNIKDLESSSRSYPTLDDLMIEQKIASKKAKTVHRRRDLDSLG